MAAVPELNQGLHDFENANDELMFQHGDQPSFDADEEAAEQMGLSLGFEYCCQWMDDVRAASSCVMLITSDSTFEIRLN